MAKSAKELIAEARDILRANAMLAITHDRAAVKVTLMRKGWSPARADKAIDSAIKIGAYLK